LKIWKKQEHILRAENRYNVIMNSKKQIKYAKQLISKVLSKYKRNPFFFKSQEEISINEEYLMNCSYEEMNTIIKKSWNLIDGKTDNLGVISKALHY